MKTIKLLIFGLLIATNLNSQLVQIDIDNSNIKWTGKEITTKIHYGSLKFIKGEILFEKNKIVSGEFIVDMTTLNVEDLTGSSKNYLEKHLRSNDFFSVKKHNQSSLIITDSKLIESNKYMVNGILKIKGIENNISFVMNKVDDSSINSNLTFDRTKYDVRYRSGNFFQNLGDKLIYDDIELEVSLTLIN